MNLSLKEAQAIVELARVRTPTRRMALYSRTRSLSRDMPLLP
jgi:hypothetical protein